MLVKNSVFHLQGKPNQTARQGLSARIRFAGANIIFSFAACFRRPPVSGLSITELFFDNSKNMLYLAEDQMSKARADRTAF